VSDAEPVFFYDFSSPYAYLSAHRVDELLPAPPRWQPILFGALILDIGKEPWSWREGPARDARMRECERRAAALGLPLRWPRDWPRGTYSVLVLRAALVAEELGRLRDFSLAAYRHGLGLGRDLTDVEVVVEAAAEAGIEGEAVRAGVGRPEIKARLREATDAARERGVTGIPTVAVGEELFWGDDRLEAAARALLGGASLGGTALGGARGGTALGPPGQRSDAGRGLA
jgi:2-hydroxychromene-2-carboxylate isomerase